MNQKVHSVRFSVLTISLVVVILVLVGRLFYLQVIDSKYVQSARNNVLRYQVQHPPRGEVLDRNGEYLIQSKESYDLMMVARDVEPFDTAAFAQRLGVTKEDFIDKFNRARRISTRKPTVVYKQLSKEVKLRLDERGVKGFYTLYRTVRSYPRKMAGNLLGYVGEVNQRAIDRDNYYEAGDYIGLSGIESAYEKLLRGQKGVKVEMVDAFGMPQGSYGDGIYDSMAVHGAQLTSTLDGELQQLAEELLQGKIGSCVAIEPSTGEILVMASSPSYDPDMLIGKERGNNYARMSLDNTRPLFNRAVMAKYPPGSTFKMVTGLIGLQEGVVTPQTDYSCHGGYFVGRGLACHAHSSPVDMYQAIATSCNTYFCHVFRDIIDSRANAKSRDEAFDRWREYVMSFGFGRKLGSDFLGELSGYVPDAAFYNRTYRGSWNSLTTISLSIGQGELGTTPLQMANLAAILANRGYYYIPHVVKKIEGQESIDPKFLERNYTMVDTKHFEDVVQGMYDAMHVPGGTGYYVNLPGLEMCGKTGTAENPGVDHSVFISFAPKDDPKIAVAVYVEHGRFGASAAGPIASLLMEQYLTDTITRTDMVQRYKDLKINYNNYNLR